MVVFLVVRVVKARMRCSDVGERAQEWHVVRVDAVAERQLVTDQLASATKQIYAAATSYESIATAINNTKMTARYASFCSTL